jgi:undecaprenyl diphosphate synthase
MLKRSGDGERSKGDFPEHVAAGLGDSPEPATVRGFYVWCDELGVSRATVCLPDAVERGRYADAVAGLEPSVRVVDGRDAGGIRSKDAGRADATDGEADVSERRVLSYAGGREEVVGALRGIAEDVEAGEISPDDVDSEGIDERLAVRGEPDLVVETSDGSLSDSLVWQTVYSELCHVEKLDRDALRRCVEDYRERERRYGR